MNCELLVQKILLNSVDQNFLVVFLDNSNMGYNENSRAGPLIDSSTDCAPTFY